MNYVARGISFGAKVIKDDEQRRVWINLLYNFVFYYRTLLNYLFY